MTMRRMLSLLLLFAMSAWCLPDGVADLARRLAHRSAFECDFRQERTLPGMKAPLRSTGVFQLMPQRHALWIQKTPIAQRILVRESGLELLRPDGTTQKLSASTPVAGDLVRALFALTQGDLNGLEKNFNVSWLRQGTTNWGLRLTGRGSVTRAVKEITISGRQDDVRALQLLDAQGLTTKIRFGAPRPLKTSP